mmetsp:Transcript_5587/g.5776  ORF Transcript_5587/g.5776 Transcript_5587/m.5776 type:complete len:165 (+) Transcript_5587:83-577(+)
MINFQIFKECAMVTWNVTKFCCILHFGTTYVGNVTLCVGPSMVPTFDEKGDLVVVDCFSQKILHRSYQQGDVVISVCPYDPEKTICKRIVALPGDTVSVQKKEYGQIRDTITTVPRGHVWLQGDNPLNSTDSRSYGSVPMGLILGRVVLKLAMPPQRIESEIAR